MAISGETAGNGGGEGQAGREAGLKARQEDILRRLSGISETLSSAVKRQGVGKGGAAAAAAGADVAAVFVASPELLGHEGDGPISETQARLAVECYNKGLTSVIFRRVPMYYYDRPLEERRRLLGAESIESMCKTIVMVNSAAPPEIVDCSDRTCSKYYAILVQYAAKLDTEKLRTFIHALGGGKIPKKRINMRLAPEEDSDQLTGYTHNSVTPIGLATDIPIILSDQIAALSGFWMGAGEVDLKMRVNTAQFVRAYNVLTADCTEE